MGNLFRKRPEWVPSPKFSKRTKRRDSVVESSKERDIRLDYVFHRVLGEGRYGKVRRAMRKVDSQRVAVKSILKKEIRKPELLRHEVEALSRLEHVNIVKLLDVYEDPTHVHMVMELCSGGELFARIVEHGQLTEMVAADLMRQVLSAVAHLHSRKIVHRDLKPENILFAREKSWTLKVCDFGLSRFFDSCSEEMTSRLGTAFYVSPEVLNRKYTSKCDIWSLGVVLYIMLCGYPPFYGASDPLIFKSILEDQVKFEGEAWQNVSPEAKKFVLRLLDRDEHARPSAEEALNEKGWLLGEASGTIAVTTTAIESLKRFCAMNTFKRAALNHIAKSLSKKELGELEREFRTIDSDLDGYITRAELTEAMKRTKSLAQVHVLLEELDENGDDCIDWNEYIQGAVARKDFLRDERIAETFRYFDEDESGKISISEMQQVLGASTDISEMMKNADLNEDGEIDFSEFRTMLLKSISGREEHVKNSGTVALG